jgi:alpha-L-rhamnosidase
MEALIHHIFMRTVMFIVPRYRRFRAFAVSLLLFSAFAAISQAEENKAGLQCNGLRCESMIDPLGIDTAQPRLSWLLQASPSSERDQKQTAYQILVASTTELLNKDQGDLWDSGKVISNNTIQIEYAGKPLNSRMQCHWKVRVWDREGNASAWSPAAVWELALIQPDDWKAQWINDGKAVPTQSAEFFKDDPAPLFRKEFVVDKPVHRARLYMSGLGYGYAKLNGSEVGDRVLDPAMTNYSKRVLYSIYDVTSQIAEGRNCLGLTLGNGWYNLLPLKMWGRFNLRDVLTVGRPRGIAQLEIEFKDGTRQIVGTDESWKVTDGPVLRNSIYLGEIYDARKEIPSWSKPGFDDSAWRNAKPATEPVGPLQAEMQPPIRATAKLVPVSRKEVKPGVFVFDMGQNFAGWVQMHVQGPAGTKVKLRFGELLNPDGTLNVMTSVAGQIKTGKENDDGEYPKLAYQSDTYILSGHGKEVYTPRFCWHAFRYVEVTGYPGTPEPTALKGLRLSADVQDAGHFACSNDAFNRIQTMVQWTFLSNLFGVQSDCPHRERFGYGGDIVPTCDAMIFNYDMANFYAKVVQDFADAARPNGGMTEIAPFNGIADEGFGEGTGPMGWQIAYPLLQAKLYQYYGDLRLIREQYPVAKRHLEFIRANSQDCIVQKCIGDHETLETKLVALTSTAFYYDQAVMVAKFAELLGKQDDAKQYHELAEQIRAAFIAKFFKSDEGRFSNGSQACQACALHFDLLPPDRRNDVIKALRSEVDRHDGHLATGIFGTRYVLETLSRYGSPDAAYDIVNKTGFPGWRHMLDSGATTLWEHWEFSDNTYSHNHPMFGSVSTWFFEDLGGIRPDHDAVGFDRFTIHPKIVKDLNHAEASYASVRGLVACNWRVESGVLKMDVTVPPNVNATVFVPTSDPTTVTESGKPIATSRDVQALPTQDHEAVFELGGGTYHFEAKLK